MTKLTPMMEQYMRLKQAHTNAILMFRLGDFFEMFFDDAVVASKSLGIALTGRDSGSGERVPMCGVPAHAVDGYIAKLIEKGFNVAIADQVEDAKHAKGIVKREVVRVVTPGTVMEENLLDEGKNNYIAALYASDGVFYLAACDVTTGDFSATELFSDKMLFDELARLNPAELILPEGYKKLKSAETFAKKITYSAPWTFNLPSAYKCLTAHFGTLHLEGFGIKSNQAVVAPLGALLEYIKETAKYSLVQITKIRVYSCTGKMQLDIASRRNLELTYAGQERGFKGSLLWVLDRTKTAMGKRLIRSFVESPLIFSEEINKRLESVGEWKQMPLERAEIREYLSKTVDIERLMARLSSNSGTARDLAALGSSFALLPKIHRLLRHNKACINSSIRDFFDDLADITKKITITITESPPATVRLGGMINVGVSEELDHVKNIRQNAESLLQEMEKNEREKTNISSLKIRFTKVFGYYIEVSKTNVSKVPERFFRKQTLANAERYTTDELRELEETLLGADEKIILIEYELFEKLRQEILLEMSRVQFMAGSLAALDVLSALAEVAEENGYTAPIVNDLGKIKIRDGRHPVVESIREESFIPNDTDISDANRLAIITGPNMAGKSTYMRQVALIVLMSQIGSFVPASYAEIGVVDRIFTRVGASDDLATGQSTFMVEMTEVANILNSATKNSLVLLDEIGRGTSTYDGLSIAWATLEYIACKLKAKTLFATHYHELTSLEGSVSGVSNYCFTALEQSKNIVFTRKLMTGAAGQSYGIHVARLAGLPRELLKRALNVQKNLLHHAPKSKAPDISEAEFEIDYTEENPVALAVREIDVNTLSPIEALLKLAELKKIEAKSTEML